MSFVESKIPMLRTMRDSDPITGEVWVVDENNHQVACFRVKRPECHMKGATKDNMDAALNLDLAKSLIEYLSDRWNIERFLKKDPCSTQQSNSSSVSACANNL